MKRKRNQASPSPKAKHDPVPFVPKTTLSPLRRWCFRLLAVLLPLFGFGLLEIGLRVAGYGHPTTFFLQANDQGRTMLTDNPRFGWSFFPPAIARTPHPLYLPERRPPNTVRVFVFGESAAFGDPSPAFGLPRVLEVLLRNRYPDVRFEVINAAMTAINSHVILPIARDCAREEGDVWVLYVGNNEVVGPYGGGTVFGPQVPSRSVVRASIRLNTFKLGQLLANAVGALFDGAAPKPAGVSLDQFLDHKVQHDDPRMAKVYAHFSRNLEDIVKAGTGSGAQVVVSTVASNLKDCAPFASMHRTGLDAAGKAEWERLYQQGSDAERVGKLVEARDAYDAAGRIDDHWAELHFRQGRLLWKLGDFLGARHHFTLARDYDALRFRADSRINEIISQTCSNRLDEGVAWLDGNEVLAQQSAQGVLGAELLYEHVHLNFSGNYRLARAIAGQITGVLKLPALAGKAPASGDWLSEEECAAQLGLNDWDRCQTLGIVRQRLDSVPFTLQLNHAEQLERIQTEYEQCRNRLAAQTLAASVQRCEQALARNPQDWELHRKLALLLKEMPDQSLQDRALGEWRQVLELMPVNSEARYEMGVLLDRAGQTAEAETQLRRALERQGDNQPNALNALGHVLAAQNRLNEAVENYERALRLKPNFPEALVNLGEALNRLGRTAEAKARLEEATRLSPHNTNAAIQLGRLLDEKGEVSAAITRYAEMLRTNPSDAAAHYGLARCFGFQGRSPEAQEHYASALRLQPDFAEAHSQLGLELAKAGKEGEALRHFREAVRLQPASASAHKDLGIALARQRQFEEAAKEFAETLRLAPGDATAQTYLQAAQRAQAASR